jgi:hypothetical protein
MRRARRIAIGLILALCSAQARADDAPEIANEVGATEIFIGESVDYVVEVRNVDDPPAPDLSAVRTNFDVSANGDESRNQSSISIINGRVSQRKVLSHVFHYRLTPRRAGRLEIPAPSVTIDGKRITGSALTIDVQAPEQQDLVIPEITTDRRTVYPTQPFEVTLRILVHPLPNDAQRDPLAPLRRQPPHIEINWVELPAGLSGDDKVRWLEKSLADDGVGFTLNDLTTRSRSFFDSQSAAIFNLAHGRAGRKTRDGKIVNYFVYELTRKLTAEKTGTYALGPAVIKGTFADGTQGDTYTGRRLVAIAPAVRVEVREVPTPRPATFCGGIGNYGLTASASPSALRVGDPLTLKLEFERERGSGSLDLIAAPDLRAIPALAADFEVVDQHPVGRTEGNKKQFEYALRPKRAGANIPTLAVTVFDPDRETFAELNTRPIPLSVSEATRLGAGDLFGSVAGPGPDTIRAKERGIFQNITDPSQLSDQRVNLPALGAVATGSWAFAGCLIVAVRSYRRKSGDVGWQRKRTAQRTASRKLAEARAALAAGQSRDALRGVRSALIGLIADTRNLVGEGLTASEAERSLANSSVPEAERTAVARLLDAIESAEYGSGSTTETAAIVETAEGLIPRLARHLGRSW